MRDKLSPLGLYRLSEGDVTDAELKAYAEGLDPLFELIDELEREGFIPTAESYGLSSREGFIDREKSALTVERRRELLLGAERSRMLIPSAAAFRQYLSDIGLLSFSIGEHPTRQRMDLYVNDSLTQEEKRLIGEKIERACPAHLSVTAYYNGMGSETY